MLTSGSEACAAATAVFASSHPARNGAAAANINATHADRLRNPDIETVAPEFEFGRGLQSAQGTAPRRGDESGPF
jgi:hypothetical protein